MAGESVTRKYDLFRTGGQATERTGIRSKLRGRETHDKKRKNHPPYKCAIALLRMRKNSLIKSFLSATLQKAIILNK